MGVQQLKALLVQHYKSEILSKKHLAALNGAPFWILEHVRHLEYDYRILLIRGYSLLNYPLVPKIRVLNASNLDKELEDFSAVFVKFTTLALTRQLSKESANERSYALSDKEELKRVVLQFKLKGLTFHSWS